MKILAPVRVLVFVRVQKMEIIWQIWSTNRPTVASLVLVSPGAATDGVTLFFFLKKIWRLFFLVIASESDGLFSCRLLTTHLPTSFIQCFFYIQPQKIILGRVSPPGGVSRGGPLPLPPLVLVKPLPTYRLKMTMYYVFVACDLLCAHMTPPICRASFELKNKSRKVSIIFTIQSIVVRCRQTVA